MKKVLALVVLILPLLLHAQDFKFYFRGKDIEQNTFDIKNDSIVIKVVFNNTTKFKFFIESVQVVLRIPTPSQGVAQQAYSGEVQTKTMVITNAFSTFSLSPVFVFDLKPLLDQHAGCTSCEIVFKVNKMVSDSEVGTGWIKQHLFFREVLLKKSITSNPGMERKGNSR